MATTTHELPGMVELSPEAHAAGVAPGLTAWRATYPFEVTVELHAAGLADAETQAGAECLMLEELGKLGLWAPCELVATADARDIPASARVEVLLEKRRQARAAIEG